MIDSGGDDEIHASLRSWSDKNVCPTDGEASFCGAKGDGGYFVGGGGGTAAWAANCGIWLMGVQLPIEALQTWVAGVI